VEEKPSGLGLRLGCDLSAAAESWASIGVNTRFSRLPTPKARVVGGRNIRMMAGFKWIGFMTISVPSPSVPHHLGLALRATARDAAQYFPFSHRTKLTSPLTRTTTASGIRTSDFDPGCSCPHGQAGHSSLFAPFPPSQSTPLPWMRWLPISTCRGGGLVVWYWTKRNPLCSGEDLVITGWPSVNLES
jgi:hypothetical protein